LSFNILTTERREGMKLECQGCRKRIIFKDGSLDKKRAIECPRCGFKNIVEKKKNGKVIVINPNEF